MKSTKSKLSTTKNWQDNIENAKIFLQALKFNDKEPCIGVKTKAFANSNELMISTPAVICGEMSETHLVYKVNLARDLGMDLTNDDLTAWLIKEVEQRMQVIEDELGEVFC